MIDKRRAFKWFALGADHNLYYVGVFVHSDDAYENAEEIMGDVPVVWLINETVAHHWKAILELVLDAKPIN